MLWTKGRGGGGGRPLEHLENPQLFGSVALVADTQDHHIQPWRRSVALASRLSKANHSPQLRALEWLLLPALFGQGLATRAGNSPLPPTTPPSKGPLNGFLQEGRQASTCDLEFISYPRTWLSRVQRNPRLICVVSRVRAYLHPVIFSKGPWPQQVKSTS